MANGRRRGRPRAPLSTGVFPENITDEDLDRIPAPPEHLNPDGQLMYYRLLAYGSAFLEVMDHPQVIETAEIFQAKERYRRLVALGIWPELVFQDHQKRWEVHAGRKLLTETMAALNSNLQLLGFSPFERKKLGVEQAQADKITEFMEREAAEAERMREQWEEFLEEQREVSDDAF